MIINFNVTKKTTHEELIKMTIDICQDLLSEITVEDSNIATKELTLIGMIGQTLSVYFLTNKAMNDAKGNFALSRELARAMAADTAISTSEGVIKHIDAYESGELKAERLGDRP